MSKTGGPDKLSATHHALLFAWLARALIELAGKERGEETIRLAVRRYGKQRGRRMALRARTNGHRLTVTNYMAYGEWAAAPGEAAQTMVDRTPHARLLVSRCPWYTAWKENDLIQYGQIYCQEIDGALLRGFNPALTIQVPATLSGGAACCEFVFRDAQLTLPQRLLITCRKRFKPGKNALMPWAYHMGHLYKVISETVVEQQGPDALVAVDNGMRIFGDRFGDQVVEQTLRWKDTDFDALPGAIRS